MSREKPQSPQFLNFFNRTFRRPHLPNITSSLDTRYLPSFVTGSIIAISLPITLSEVLCHADRQLRFVTASTNPHTCGGVLHGLPYFRLTLQCKRYCIRINRINKYSLNGSNKLVLSLSTEVYFNVKDREVNTKRKSFDPFQAATFLGEVNLATLTGPST